MGGDEARDRALLDEVRRQRAELREGMGVLELALAAPAPAGLTGHWLERVHTALTELAGDLRQHVAITEGPDGLYQDLLRTAPRLSGPVATLTADHGQIGALLDELLSSSDGSTDEADEADVGQVRALGTALLERIVRHRQQGADLVYEAYEVDVSGGE
jgi:hypothetical protein